MAEATEQSKTIVESVTLVLTPKEAEAVFALVGIVCGGWDESTGDLSENRKACDRVYDALENLPMFREFGSSAGTEFGQAIRSQSIVLAGEPMSPEPVAPRRRELLDGSTDVEPPF